MNLKLQGHHVALSETMKIQVKEKLSWLETHGNQITSSDVLLKLDDHGKHTAEATLHLPGKTIHAKADSNDMYASINALIKKLQNQLQKNHDKKHNPSGRMKHSKNWTSELD